MVEAVALRGNEAQLTLNFVLKARDSFRVNEDMRGHQVEVGRDGKDVYIVNQGHARHVLDFGAKGIEVYVLRHPAQQDVE